MKYLKGDTVFYFGTDECEVLDILPNAASDKWKSDLLVLKFKNGETRKIAATLVEPKPDQQLSLNDNISKYVDIVHSTNLQDGIGNKLITEINAAVNQILNNPKIKSAKKTKEIAYRLFEYIIRTSKYDTSVMDEKENETSLLDMEIKDIHRCLCEHRSVCTSDASALSLLFRRVGISSTHLTIAEKGCEPKGIHEVVKMDFDGQQFICDPTLVRTALENGQIPDIHPSVFAFTPNKFFEILYPTKEVKFEHEPIVE